MRPRARCASALLLFLLLPAGRAAAGPWLVRVLGVDASRAAAPRESGGAVLVDLAALAPFVGLGVQVESGMVRIRDREGRSWSGTAGDSRLTSPGEEILLAVPLRLEGVSAYLPAAAVARLAGLFLVLTPAEHRIDLVAAPVAQQAPVDGWEPIAVERAPAPQEAGRPAARSRSRQPAERESLRLETALAHVVGADYGGELTAVGTVGGWETRMSGLLTGGGAGLYMTQGTAFVTDPETGWGGEAGDLFSEIRGSARGARLLWRRGTESEPRAWPSLSLYLADGADGEEGRGTVLAYQDAVDLGRGAGLSGEVASDGSWLLHGRWERGRLGLFGFWRNGDAGRGEGLSASLELPRGAGMQAGWSRSGEGADRFEQTTFSLRVPLILAADLGVESMALESAFGQGRSDSVLLGMPVGPVRLRVRWQRRWSEVVPLSGRPPVQSEQREMRATAAFAAGARWRFELQSVNAQAGGVAREPWQQLAVSWRAGKGTTLQLWALSAGAPADDPLRVRLTRELPRGFSLFAEYGRLSPFQEEEGAPGDPPHFKLQVRRVWQLGTPAGGGLVTGRVLSPLGPPPAGTAVEVGPYRTVTAADGSYAIPHVPRGTYEARVPEDALPAAWIARGGPREVEIRGRGHAEIDLELVPLGHVRGRVWEDLDRDGRPGAGEGVGGAAVLLGASATRTEADGSFGFFNVPPGAYRLELAADLLPEGYAPGLPARLDLGLPPGRSLDGLGLRVVRVERPVFFQELR
jgi:hypothetical protein